MIVVYIRIYQTALRQVNALRCGQKQNVVASDGTQVTLRMHRGGYRGLNHNESAQKASQSETVPAVSRPKSHQHSTNNNNNILMKSVSKTDSLCSYRPRKSTSKINKSLTWLTINQIRKNRDLAAMSLSYSQLADALGPETKQNSRSSLLNRVQQTNELVQSGQKLQMSNPNKPATVKHFSLLYYPSLSREYNTQAAVSLRHNSFREQFRRSIRLNHLSSDEIMRLSVSCNNLEKGLMVNMKSTGTSESKSIVNEPAKRNTNFEVNACERKKFIIN